METRPPPFERGGALTAVSIQKTYAGAQNNPEGWVGGLSGRGMSLRWQRATLARQKNAMLVGTANSSNRLTR